MPPNDFSVTVIGAGPAGLTAAFTLAGRGIPVTVLEKDDVLGGLARTEEYRGYRFDIGGHRFFTRIPEVELIWNDLLDSDFLPVKRLSRIFYRNKYFHYPLNLSNTLLHLGPWESLLVLASFFKTRLSPHPREDTFEQWVTNRFGDRLYRTFFKSYTEKVWGIPCSLIEAEWAAQRIKGLSLKSILSHALFRTNNAKSLIHTFHYPALGPGSLWQRMKDRIEQGGGEVRLGANVVRLRHERGEVRSVFLGNGRMTEALSGKAFISTTPLSELIRILDPSPPAVVREAAGCLRHRAFILVGLILGRKNLFPDQWIYIHSPEFRVGRIQNYKNWSAAMVPDADKTSLGMEYFCSEGDEIWALGDAGLIDLASRELARLGLARRRDAEDGVVFRQRFAYPLYDREYRKNLEIVRQYLAGFSNLQSIGRNGLHRYNNQDHSMFTGLRAVDNIFGASHDLWEVSSRQDYLE